MNFGDGISISPTRKVTPEGYLLCKECRIARVGGREYLAEEIANVQPVDGKVTVMRSADSLFAPETIASLEGKPVCLEHPPGAEMFDANTWKNFIKGVMLHVAPGSGADAGCLVADLLIYDKDAINAIMSGEATELSLGYFSEVKDAGGGIGVESPLQGNHVALVPRGRCGSICAVKDSATNQTATGDKMSFFKKDADPAGEASPAANDEKLKALQDQVTALQDQIAELQKSAPTADADPEGQPEPNPEEGAQPPAQEGSPDDKKGDGIVTPAQPEPAKSPDFVATPEAIAEIVNRVLEAREAANIVDECVKKDAATVAPKLDAATPNLALAALAEYAKTEAGKAILDEYGGLDAIKKDAAPDVLKSCAIAERMRAKNGLAMGRKDSATVERPSFFEQAKKLWN